MPKPVGHVVDGADHVLDRLELDAGVGDADHEGSEVGVGLDQGRLKDRRVLKQPEQAGLGVEGLEPLRQHGRGVGLLFVVGVGGAVEGRSHRGVGLEVGLDDGRPVENLFLVHAC